MMVTTDPGVAQYLSSVLQQMSGAPAAPVSIGRSARACSPLRRARRAQTGCWRASCRRWCWWSPASRPRRSWSAGRSTSRPAARRPAAGARPRTARRTLGGACSGVPLSLHCTTGADAARGRGGQAAAREAGERDHVRDTGHHPAGALCWARPPRPPARARCWAARGRCRATRARCRAPTARSRGPRGTLSRARRSRPASPSCRCCRTRARSTCWSTRTATRPCPGSGARARAPRRRALGSDAPAARAAACARADVQPTSQLPACPALPTNTRLRPCVCAALPRLAVDPEPTSLIISKPSNAAPGRALAQRLLRPWRTRRTSCARRREDSDARVIVNPADVQLRSFNTKVPRLRRLPASRTCARASPDARLSVAADAWVGCRQVHKVEALVSYKADVE